MIEGQEDVFDSTILIDALNGYQAARTLIRRTNRPLISVVTWIEVLAGTDADEEIAIRAFLLRFHVVELTPDIQERSVLIRRGSRLKLADTIIFATAQMRGVTLVTRNTKDFPVGTPGVSVPYTFTP